MSLLCSIIRWALHGIIEPLKRLLHVNQGVAVMGRNTTGSPGSVGSLTAYALGGHCADHSRPAADRPTRRQRYRWRLMLTDARRWQTPALVTSLAPYTMCRRASNKTETKRACFFRRNWFISVLFQCFVHVKQKRRRGFSANQSIATAVIAVTARDHVLRRHNVIGWNRFASWIFFHMRIDMVIGLKQL